ncbi:MAG: hypothetical protein RL426_890, partial [Pseudomonadota bacterium]
KNNIQYLFNNMAIHPNDVDLL